MRRRERIALAVLLLAALAVRLAWGLSRPTTVQSLQSLPDQIEYLSLGRNLLAGNGLVMHDDRLDADVRAFRTPGYPLLIASVGGNVRAVRAIQALLDTSTVLATFLLAARFLSCPRALFAALLAAFNPFLVYFSALLLSETLFIAMLVWGMFLLCNRDGLRWWWFGIVVLSLGVLVRPGAIVLPVLLAFVYPRSGEWSMRRAASSAMIAAIVLVIVLLPWAVRNDRAVGRMVWTTTNAGFTMYDGFHPSATGASDQKFVTELAPILREKDEVERSRYLNREASRFIAENPGRAAILALKKIARTWSPVPLSREYGRNVLLLMVAGLFTVALFALTAWAFFRSKLSIAAKVFLLLPAIYFTVAHAVSVGSLRYRLPADVPMAVVAASAVLGRRMTNDE